MVILTHFLLPTRRSHRVSKLSHTEEFKSIFNSHAVRIIISRRVRIITSYGVRIIDFLSICLKPLECSTSETNPV
jgi:hypothetical protein